MQACTILHACGMADLFIAPFRSTAGDAGGGGGGGGGGRGRGRS